MLNLSQDDLKEIFGLFSSPSKYERDEIYSPDSEHYYRKVNLDEEYSLTQAKLEYSLDSIRSVFYFLTKNGFALIKDDKVIDLKDVEKEFI